MKRIRLLVAALSLASFNPSTLAADEYAAFNDPPGTFAGAASATPLVSESDRMASEALQLIVEGNLDKASAKINAALKMRTDRSYYHLINGLVYHLQAHRGTNASFELAEQGYQLAVQFDPSNWLAQYFSGQLALDMGKFDKARQHLAEALLFRHDDPALLSAFAYAAYRSGYPDLAAGSIDVLEKQGKIRSQNELRNAALIMAAVGKNDRAGAYLERLKELGGTQRADYVARRLDDWAGFYRQQEGLLKTDGVPFGSIVQNPSNLSFNSHPDAAATPQALLPTTAPGTENRMVVVDVVMIATEETLTTARGLNLLNALQLQFGSSTAAAFSKSISNVNTSGSLADTQSITRVLSIPAITYSLNIANSNVQRNEILARPTLVATSGRLSEFFYGIELNAAVAPGGNSAAAPVSIQKDIGIKLAVTPVFIEGGQVSMLVAAQRSFIKTPSADNNYQFKLETSKSQVTANVVMRFGETLIMGGLSEKEADITRDGVPLLQDIPGVQYLFSRATTTDVQKSVLILITPRPAQYIYQTEKARQEYEKTLSEEDRPIASLRARYGDWFKPYPNWASIFHHMQENSLYREFRTGDVTLESWSDMRTLKDRLKLLSDFLYY
ncbi:MAG: hypothetical protein KGZ83_18120 [Sulfuricella sp.]|nr:hypothetical protein [Sulfuricella sp.]